MTFVLDRDGGAEVLKVNAAPLIAELANQIAAAAGNDATVEIGTTDRARAKVSVPADAQAKDGVLSRAASDAGLPVIPFKERVRRPKDTKSTKRTTTSRKRGRPRKNTTNT